MPTLYIREYASIAAAQFLGGPAASAVPCPQEPCLAQQRVPIDAENELSAPFSSQTRFIRVSTDADCLIDIGPTPDAAKRGSLLPAGATEFFGTSEGHKVSAMEAP